MISRKEAKNLLNDVYGVSCGINNIDPLAWEDIKACSKWAGYSDDGLLAIYRQCQEIQLWGRVALNQLGHDIQFKKAGTK